MGKVLKSYFRIGTLSLIMFFFVFSISIPSLPSFFVTWRICTIIFFLNALLITKGKIIEKNSHSLKMFKIYYIWQIFLLIYTIIILLSIGFGKGQNSIDLYLNMIIFLPLVCFSIGRSFKSIDEIMIVILIICILQGLIIIIAIINNNFKNYLILNFYTGNNWRLSLEGGIERLIDEGYAIGFGCVAAEGALKLSFGLLASIYMINNQKKNKLVYIIIFCFIAITTSLMSRTGFILSCLALFLIILNTKKNNILKEIKIIIIIVVMFSLIYLYILNSGYINILQFSFSRLGFLFKNGLWNSFFKHYIYGSNTSIPRISAETILGTGIYSGLSGNGIFVNADGGFLKSYVSMGLLMAIINYLIISKILIGEVKYFGKKNRNTWIFLLIYVIIGEFKEYIVYHHNLILLVFAILFLYERTIKIDKLSI